MKINWTLYIIVSTNLKSKSIETNPMSVYFQTQYIYVLIK